ncbi:MAG: EAL domain-containing protein [Hyphomicrobiaceae bacterium]
MTQQVATPDEAPANGFRYGDAFVILSVTVLSCAIGAWLQQQLELPLWAGMIAALAAYAVLLSLHLLMRRSLGVDARAALPALDPATDREVRNEQPLPAAQAPMQPPEGETGRPAMASPPPPAAREIAEKEPAEPPPASPLPPPRAASPFQFRPMREPALSPTLPSSAAPPPLPGAQARPAQPQPSAPAATSQPEISVDFVEESIKKLADALNSATPGERPGAQAERADNAEAMIGRSVEALQTAARAMRTPPAAPAEKSRSWWRPGAARKLQRQPPPLARRPAPSSQGNSQLARIAEALAAERMEVLLEPIQGLAEGKPRHFQISMRLHTADGAALDERELVRAAFGSGLMPSIDAARIIRAARVATRLGRRGRQGAVLATMAGESLTDTQFLETAASGLATNSGMTLVLAFAQSEVRTFTHAHARALNALAPMGFRFGLEAVTDLDMDFAGLREMGFAFVELDAPVFLEGLPCAGGRIPASDVCRHLSNFGLSLVVGRIDDEWQLARILGFGVMFGKGTLFGGPRLVKDEVVADPAVA